MIPVCRNLLLLLSLCLLTGCVTGKIHKPMKRETALTYQVESTAQAQEGYLVGSFAFSGKHPSKIAQALGSDNFRYNNYSFSFGQVESDEKTRGNIGATGSFFLGQYETEFSVEAGNGYVFAIPLPAGKYAFDGYSFFLNNGMSQQTWYALEDFVIPFAIEPGKALYVGEVRAVHHFGKNLFGITIPTGGHFEVLESSQRDLPLIKDKYPFLNNVSILTAVPHMQKELADYYTGMPADLNLDRASFAQPLQ